MPTFSTSAFGRLARKLVNESLIVQISGKMLIANSSSIVRALNSHAIARSERPRMRRNNGAGVASAARRASCSVALIGRVRGSGRHRAAGATVRRPAFGELLQLAVLLEHLLPVGEQAVER